MSKQKTVLICDLYVAQRLQQIALGFDQELHRLLHKFNCDSTGDPLATTCGISNDDAPSNRLAPAFHSPICSSNATAQAALGFANPAASAPVPEGPAPSISAVVTFGQNGDTHSKTKDKLLLEKDLKSLKTGHSSPLLQNANLNGDQDDSILLSVISHPSPLDLIFTPPPLPPLFL